MAGKGKKKAPKKNRLLGFSGTLTDEEIDEAIDLFMRFGLRVLARRDFLEMTRRAARSSAFGDA